MSRYHNERFGRHGERIAKLLLEQRGHKVRYYGGTNGFDLLVNNQVTVDVKSALMGGRGGRKGYCWQFSLQRYNERYVETIVLLLCFNSSITNDPIAVFVIPGEETVGIRKISITSRDPRTYKGKWARHRDNWSALDAALANPRPDYDEEIPF